MFDETNQMMEGGAEELPENLFEDEVEPSQSPGGDSSPKVGAKDSDSGSDSQTEQNAEDGAGGEDQTAAVEEGKAATIRVKFNGEEKDITLSEARTLAQKGMNYDHVIKERDRNKNAFDFLVERAKAEGISVEKYIENERQNAENQRIEAKMNKLREADDDASDETLRNLAKLEIANEDAERKKAEAAEEETKNNNQIEEWNKLFRAHPELIGKDGQSKLGDGVIKLVEQGYTPTEAYYMNRNRELEEQNKMLQGAEEAKKKSVGSLLGNQTTEEDDFLSGFNEF